MITTFICSYWAKLCLKSTFCTRKVRNQAMVTINGLHFATRKLNHDFIFKDEVEMDTIKIAKRVKKYLIKPMKSQVTFTFFITFER